MFIPTQKPSAYLNPKDFNKTPNKRALLLLFTFLPVLITAQDAREIVKRADENMRAKSSYSVCRMTITKPTWNRTVEMKAWALEPDYALFYITAPARDKGTVTLKRKNEVWNWIPAAQKIIKIPPSMMLSSWMGSDFTNDDLVREASVVDDYDHKLLGEETVGAYLAYKIVSIPKPDKGIVWGKIVSYISKESYLNLKSEYYDEDGILVKIFNGSQEKTFDGRRIMTRWEMIPQDKPNNGTVLEYIEIKFNIDVSPAFFSEQNMKRIR